MQDNCYVKMDHVNMFYPSGVYNARSIKEEMIGHLKHKKQQPLIKDVHALIDFNLDAHEGDRIGIIGRNGSGKSTLLKTIAGIYPIESGNLEVEGKIRAIFDIGLGFDPESTGRENIMYRGLLLGEKPQILKMKMQEIIDFADIGEFIDYPIKMYSSGMLIRLAVSVTVSVTGDILLMDEVINAGDASFIEKARKKVNELMENSKLMILVSHDMQTIQKICNKVIWLDKGVTKMVGDSSEVVEAYLRSI